MTRLVLLAEVEAVRGVEVMAAVVAVMLVVVVVVEGERRTEPKGRQDGPASEDVDAMKKLGMNSTHPRLGDFSDMMEIRKPSQNLYSAGI